MGRKLLFVLSNIFHPVSLSLKDAVSFAYGVSFPFSPLQLIQPIMMRMTSYLKVKSLYKITDAVQFSCDDLTTGMYR